MRHYYLTIHTPFDQNSILHPSGEPDSKLGWHKAWSDITEDGIFAVYRKDVEDVKRDNPEKPWPLN